MISSARVLSFASLAAAVACGGLEVSEVQRSITGERKLLVSQRGGLNKVAVHNTGNGGHIGDMTGDGLVLPFGVHVADQNVYVVSQGTHSIFAHLHEDGEDEAASHLLLELVPPRSGGLANPFYVTVEDGLLYASSHDTDEILRYDALTGAFIDVAVAAGAGGLDGPRGLDHAADGSLVVASSLNHQVLVYAPDGSFSRVLATGIPVPCGLAIGPRGEVCVGSAGDRGVHCFHLSGEKIYEDTDGRVCGLDFGPDGRLYTSRPDINIVEVHDLATGESAKFADTPFVVGLAIGSHRR
jgi:hypothetical protein